MNKVVVITDERGEVVATHQVPEDHPGPVPGLPSAQLVAGPGQHRHVIEIEDPERALTTSQGIHEFHQELKRRVQGATG
jgi:hypothetical protein